MTSIPDGRADVSDAPRELAITLRGNVHKLKWSVTLDGVRKQRYKTVRGALGGASMSARSDLQPLTVYGAAITKAPSGHWRIALPGVGLVFAARTPSCPRAVANVRADVRRALRAKEVAT